MPRLQATASAVVDSLILGKGISTPWLRASLLRGLDLSHPVFGFRFVTSAELVSLGESRVRMAGGDLTPLPCWAAYSRDSMSHRLLARTLAHTPVIRVAGSFRSPSPFQMLGT